MSWHECLLYTLNFKYIIVCTFCMKLHIDNFSDNLFFHLIRLFVVFRGHLRHCLLGTGVPINTFLQYCPTGMQCYWHQFLPPGIAYTTGLSHYPLVELAWRSGSVMDCYATAQGSIPMGTVYLPSFTSFARDSKWGSRSNTGRK